MTTTLVSCYFQINKSKHGHENYLKWIHNFLSNVNTPLVVFCDDESVNMLQNARGDKPMKLITQTLDDFYTAKYKQIFEANYQIDFEKHQHSVPLYMIWAEKSNFLKRAYELNHYNTDYYIWVDIGAFRNRPNKGDIPLNLIENWPSQEKMSQIPHNKVLLGKAGQFPPECEILLSNGLTKGEFTRLAKTIVGGIFAMHKSMIERWYTLYYWTLETFANNNRVILKDQSIMANISVAFPKDVKIINRIPDLDAWFFMLWLLA